MEIKFVLPPNYNQPVGGYKVVFQYANWLSKRNHDVHIYFMNSDEVFGKKQLRRMKRFLLRQSGITDKITWFDFESNVKLHFNINHKDVENIDKGVIIATFWKTASTVLKAKTASKNKYYLIQGFETFATSETNIVNTWHLPLQKIVVSKWLKQKAENLGEVAVLVPNFINSSEFYRKDIKIMNPTVSMLWHENPTKGSKLGLAALKIVKENNPNLRAIFFGKGDKPAGLPKWVTYYRGANVEELRDKIYGMSSIYLMTSEYEGWGLTAMEAMAVGTPVVSTENGGIRNFADDDSALLIPINDVSAMANALCMLLNNSELQVELRENAINRIHNFSLDSSGTLLESIFLK